MGDIEKIEGIAECLDEEMLLSYTLEFLVESQLLEMCRNRVCLQWICRTDETAHMDHQRITSLFTVHLPETCDVKVKYSVGSSNRTLEVLDSRRQC